MADGGERKALPLLPGGSDKHSAQARQGEAASSQATHHLNNPTTSSKNGALLAKRRLCIAWIGLDVC